MWICFWGKENWEESLKSSAISLAQSIVIWDGCTQHLGSLRASSQTCAIRIISALACVKHWGKGCQILPAWIYGWGGPISEVLWGIPRLTGELMAFDTFLSFFFGMWVCLWVRERDSWVGVTSSFCSSSPGIGCRLLWDVRYAAASCRYCKGSPVGLLNSWDNCWELCTSCYRSRCPSSETGVV